MFKFQATAPTRVDLAGGTLDLWPIHNIIPEKATVNIAISLNATVTVESSKDDLFHISSQDLNLTASGTYSQICSSKTLPLLGLLLSSVWNEKLPPIKITTSALSPAGAGLGGSSCLAVTTLKALDAAKCHVLEKSTPLDDKSLVQIAQDVESLVIHAPTGIQDYWGAVRGGVNILRYTFGSVHIDTFKAARWEAQNLKFICCYSGKSRASAINNWEIFKRVFDGDKSVINVLSEIGVEASRCATAILSENWTEAMQCSKREWQLRCRLWPGVETSETKALDIAAKTAGALFTRVCGAGGGGVMIAIADEQSEKQVEGAMKSANGQLLKVDLAVPGLRLMEV